MVIFFYLIGLRTTAVLGGVIATLGMGISTYFYQSIEVGPGLLVGYEFFGHLRIRFEHLD